MRGKVWRYGDHVNTDLIIPGRYLDEYDIEVIARHAMEDIDPSFASEVQEGDIIVAGRNFGCGSSREQAPLVLRQRGVGAVVAKSFSRIFFRNAINVGLPAIVSEEAYGVLRQGDVVEIDTEKGLITRESDGVSVRFDPPDPRLKEILEAGGLVSLMRERLSR